ncbi:hypothetical protein [Pseudorhodoplanes sp.]|nr:hypothetical protein [Pseudorhodoplanes sp.]HWV40659.1 hypothetical protein [Pseudorhodoplanes sp.]
MADRHAAHIGGAGRAVNCADRPSGSQHAGNSQAFAEPLQE